MRKLAALVLLFSANAYACPELTGSFTCKYQDGSTEVVTVSQAQKDGVTVYNYNGSEIPTDNATYPVPDDETIKQGTFRAWCANGVILNAQLLGKYYREGAYFGDLTINTEITIVGADLKNVTTGSIKNSGGEYPLNSEVLCTRNP